MTRLSLFALALATGTACAQAPTRPDVPRQIPTGHATTSPVGPEDASPRLTKADLPAPPTDRTETEAIVQQTIQQEGVHVVHFWAPWCGNSRAEFESGWYEVVEDHPDVSFTFVTIWNDGDDGAATLARYGIPETATVLAQPDRGPSADRDARRRTFLGLPLSWTPTTWIFNRGGTLAYAFNYGEVSAEMLATAIDDAQNAWTHD